MFAALDALQIPFCHLATHSTGGIIAARMLLMQPARFRSVFASSLFVPDSLLPDRTPQFCAGIAEARALFERVIEQTFGVSEGIWIGTPFNLNLVRESGEVQRRIREMRHSQLVLWGEKDGCKCLQIVADVQAPAQRGTRRPPGLSRAWPRPVAPG
jgi:non-heme chloroperoxidase